MMSKIDIEGLIAEADRIRHECSNDDCGVCENLAGLKSAITTLQAQLEAAEQQHLAIELEWGKVSEAMQSRIEATELSNVMLQGMMKTEGELQQRDQARALAAEAKLAEAVEVIRSFADLRGQFPQSVKLINPKLDSMSPVNITVTKGQMLAACTFIATLTPNVGDSHG